MIQKVRVINLTQAGLKAMEELAKLEEERGNLEYCEAGVRRKPWKQLVANGAGRFGRAENESVAAHVDRDTQSRFKMTRETARERVASNEMCTFLILNISSLQLIAVNMIAYRQQYGSVNPAGIIAPAIVATFVSTLTAVVYCKVKDRKRRV